MISGINNFKYFIKVELTSGQMNENKPGFNDRAFKESE